MYALVLVSAGKIWCQCGQLIRTIRIEINQTKLNYEGTRRDACNASHYLLRLLQILHTNRAQNRMKCGILHFQLLILVQILDEKVTEPRVPGELLRVEPVPYDSLVRHLVGQMAHPGAAEVQNLHLRSQNLAVEVPQVRYEFVVHVLHEPRGRVEFSVGQRVQLCSPLRRQDDALNFAGGVENTRDSRKGV